MTQKRALIVDDEPDIRELLEITLGRMNVATSCAGDFKQANDLLRDNEYDFCLTDMKLPDGNGIELVKLIQAQKPHIPVAVFTAHGNMELAIEAMKAGAFDFVSKPVDLDQLRNLVTTAIKVGKKAQEPAETDDINIIGKSAAVTKLKGRIRKLANSEAPIYISGESGSGKELAARAVHELGPRSDGPFIPVNCGAIPKELMESEFFGHTKGSFTGAHKDKAGLFQAADGGTLFLDEVADLTLDMQVKLLRALQEKAVRPVGSEEEININVRVLSATHKNLEQQVALNNFRSDLFYRINVIELSVPSLRERTEDVPLLCEYFLNRFALDTDEPVPSVSSQAMDQLKSYSFPGNIRELENILERAYTLCEGDVISPEDLALPVAGSSFSTMDDSEPDEGPISSGKNHHYKEALQGQTLDDYLENIEKEVIVSALEKVRWNKTMAAKELGISFRSLRYRLKKLELDD